MGKQLEHMEKSLAIWNDEIRERPPINPQFVAERLGLTPAEGRIAAALAEGTTTRGIAEASGRAVGTIRYQYKRIYRKLKISTQAQLVRVLLLLPHGRTTSCNADAEPPGRCNR